MRDSLSDAIKIVLKSSDKPLSVWEVYERLPSMNWLVSVQHVQNQLKQWRRRNSCWLLIHEVRELHGRHWVLWRYSINRGVKKIK